MIEKILRRFAYVRAIEASLAAVARENEELKGFIQDQKALIKEAAKVASHQGSLIEALQNRVASLEKEKAQAKRDVRAGIVELSKAVETLHSVVNKKFPERRAA
jgi:hypothetical protein